MSARSIRAGVIGLGVGEQHLRSYSAIADCEVVSVCDINPVQLQDVADRWNVSGRHTDFRKITENPDIDVVSICSYDDAHVEQAISAFEHGKHVMVEKPVALQSSSIFWNLFLCFICGLMKLQPQETDRFGFSFVGIFSHLKNLSYVQFMCIYMPY